VVLLIEHISIAKSFGRVNNYTIDPSQEILAIGVTNVLGPFLGAYPATGSFSRTAIKSKAGVRTPFAGVIAAGVVLLAIYALTPLFFFVPTSSLAAVIIHAVGDLVTPPSTLKRFWQISPTDLVIFFVGLSVIIFSSIEHGVFTMIGLSAALLIIRLFKAPGSFLGTVTVSTHSSAPKSAPSQSPGSSSAASVTESSRLVFLPLDGHDGSNPRIKIQSPGPGVFVYRFSESFNYINANHYIDNMITHVMSETRPTTRNMFINPGVSTINWGNERS
jgi:sodium-independent sulfate anion transporter 11